MNVYSFVFILGIILRILHFVSKITKTKLDDRFVAFVSKVFGIKLD